jgi:acyl carrier protein
MSNIEKYKEVFMTTFMVKESSLDTLKYQEIQEWDSVGHMALMAELEGTFEVELDIDDIIDFSSYEKGQEILAKYGVEFKN